MRVGIPIAPLRLYWRHSRLCVRAKTKGFESTFTNLAGYLVSMDDLPGAEVAAREAIAIYAKQEPDRQCIAVSIEHLALVSALGGDVVRAAKAEGYRIPCSAAGL